jgi:hypothetical protein
MDFYLPLPTEVETSLAESSSSSSASIITKPSVTDPAPTATTAEKKSSKAMIEDYILDLLPSTRQGMITAYYYYHFYYHFYYYYYYDIHNYDTACPTCHNL